MMRVHGIRAFVLLVALAASGCIAQGSRAETSEDDPASTSNPDSAETAFVTWHGRDPSGLTGRIMVHAGEQMGPHPEPWQDQMGPHPEPWDPDKNQAPSGTGGGSVPSDDDPN